MITKERGDIAIGFAINYYTFNGYEVCLPIGDKRPWDLLIEKDGKIKRVQVKYAGFYPKKNKCFVGLRITGGNQTYHYSKKYQNDDFDYLFVYTQSGTKYNIPWEDVLARSELSIEHDKYNRYRVM